jgi:hypothetical protein
MPKLPPGGISPLEGVMLRISAHQTCRARLSVALRTQSQLLVTIDLPYDNLL